MPKQDEDRVCDSNIFEILILTVASMISYMISTVKIGISNIIESQTVSSSRLGSFLFTFLKFDQ